MTDKRVNRFIQDQQALQSERIRRLCAHVAVTTALLVAIVAVASTGMTAPFI